MHPHRLYKQGLTNVRLFFFSLFFFFIIGLLSGDTARRGSTGARASGLGRRHLDLRLGLAARRSNLDWRLDNNNVVVGYLSDLNPGFAETVSGYAS